MTKFLVAVVTIILMTYGHAFSQNRSTLVIAVDLSQSVAVRGPDGKSEFQKNVEAVTKQLAQVPADSRVTVIGITDHSFTQPDILLSATIPGDPGYFGERLKAARGQLIQGWTRRIAKLGPHYDHTDIIGALLLSEQIFDQAPGVGQKIFVIYSDMRHSTPELNLENPTIMPEVSQIGDGHRVPPVNLKGVQVFVFGVDGAGKSSEYWQSLRALWIHYFSVNGATLRSFSVLR